MATTMLRKMFIPSASPPGCRASRVFCCSRVFCRSPGESHRRPRIFDLDHEWGPVDTAGLAALFILALFMIYGAKSSPFLYFQF